MEQYAWTFWKISGAQPLPWRRRSFPFKLCFLLLHLMILRMLLLRNRSELSISYLVLFLVHYNIASEATVGWELIGMTIYHFLKIKRNDWYLCTTVSLWPWLMNGSKVGMSIQSEFCSIHHMSQCLQHSWQLYSCNVTPVNMFVVMTSDNFFSLYYGFPLLLNYSCIFSVQRSV